MPSREDRMAERLRGAQRHQLGDASFNFVIPALGPDAIPSSIHNPESEPDLELAPIPSRPSVAHPALDGTTPSQSAGERETRNGDSHPPSTVRPSTAPPSQQGTPAESNTEDQSPSDLPTLSVRRSTAPRGPARARTPEIERPVAEDLGTLPDRTPYQPSEAQGRVMVVGEVEESPAHAPGSGRLRSVLVSADTTATTTSSSRLLNDALLSGDEDGPLSSSPLVRKTRRSGGTSAAEKRVSRRRSSKPSFSTIDIADLADLTPGQLLESNEPEGESVPGDDPESVVAPSLSQYDTEEAEDHHRRQRSVRARLNRRGPALTQERREQHEAHYAELHHAETVEEGDEPEPESEEEPEEAEEITAAEAARVLGRKRPRRSLRLASPELDSGPQGRAAEPGEGEPAEDPAEEPAPKRQRQRRRQQAVAETAVSTLRGRAREREQEQERERVREQEQGPRRAKAKTKKARRPRADRAEEEDEEAHLEITVQRFSRRLHGSEDDPNAEDVLNMAIPCSTRSGVNTVDVLRTVFEDVFEASLEEARQALGQADDPNTKREFKIKLQAMTRFREELRTRLIQHSIQVDALWALRKRFKKVQKERASLRDEVIQLRSERDHVWLQMEAVRAEHDRDRSRAMHQLNLSSAMHDIDLAVERGRSAAELSASEQKTAGLANLEAQMARLADQVCSSSAGGGALKRVRDFNAFLERAAAALESGAATGAGSDRL